MLRCLCFRVFDAVFFLHFLVHFQNTRIDRTLLIQFDELPLEKLDLAIFYFVKKKCSIENQIFTTYPRSYKSHSKFSPVEQSKRDTFASCV